MVDMSKALMMIFFLISLLPLSVALQFFAGLDAILTAKEIISQSTITDCFVTAHVDVGTAMAAS
jgi:hypothetical protein